MTAAEWTETLKTWFPQESHVIWQVVEDLRRLEQQLNPAPVQATNYDWGC